jgi:formiminoglutamate deiminase
VTTRVWCEHAALPTGTVSGVLIDIDDDRIVRVEPGVALAPDGDTIRLGGITLPGLANGHSHAFHRALRGRTHRGRGDFWVWREQMYAIAARLTPENYLALARATFAEMVLAGYTAVGEFHYVHHRPDGSPYDDSNAMGHALIQAAADAGIRLTLLDACYLRGGWKTELAAGQRRFSDGTAQAWCERVAALALPSRSASPSASPSPMCRIGAAIHSVRAVDAPSIAVVAKFAARHEMVLHAHVSEQIAENDEAAGEYGCTPTEILAQHGVLSEQFTAVHATHLTAADIGLYASARCTCCLCPTTERDLADGIGPSAELRNAGVALSIGSDQHAVIDPFEEMRGIELDERLRSMRRGAHSPAELLAVGSANGYRSLGWNNGGSIAAGALADLVTVSLGSVRLAGCDESALVDAIVFGAAPADVTDVMVGGRVVVRNGAHASIDVAASLRDSIAAVTGPGV